ncbi:MAG: IS1595 family transposase, partial [Solirubrobacterales bacterium]
KTKRSLWVCEGCGRQTSLSAGTIFAGTRTSLLNWFAAIWQLVGQKQGMSAKGFQQLMGLGSYETAWAHLHKLRRAMVRPGRDLLGGLVELDEAFVGGRETGMPGGQFEKKPPVVVAVEVRGGGGSERAGRLRMSRLADGVTKAAIADFAAEAIAAGSTIRTDGWIHYAVLEENGFGLEQTNVSHSEQPASVHLPHVHRAITLLKRWLFGTHQGSVSPHQLDYYLDEFVFRFNRRQSKHRGLLFFRLLEESVRTEPIPLKRIIGGTGGRRGTPRA